MRSNLGERERQWSTSTKKDSRENKTSCDTGSKRQIEESSSPQLSLSFVLASSCCTMGRATCQAAAAFWGSWWAWCTRNSLLWWRRRILHGLWWHSLFTLCCRDSVLPALRSTCTSIAATAQQSSCAASLSPESHKILLMLCLGVHPKKQRQGYCLTCNLPLQPTLLSVFQLIQHKSSWGAKNIAHHPPPLIHHLLLHFLKFPIGFCLKSVEGLQYTPPQSWVVRVNIFSNSRKEIKQEVPM